MNELGIICAARSSLKSIIVYINRKQELTFATNEIRI